MTHPEIRGIYVLDVRGDKWLGKHRETKHCVCVSVGSGKYLAINTRHNPGYHDFMIHASNYAFLEGEDRFIGCGFLFTLDAAKILRKVGFLNDVDAKTVYDKIRASPNILPADKKVVHSELWESFRM